MTEENEEGYTYTVTEVLDEKYFVIEIRQKGTYINKVVAKVVA